MTKTATTYEIRFTVTVDRPELRGPTYPVVAKNHKIPTTWRYSSMAAAKAQLEAIASGREDYQAEYVSSYQLIQVCANGRKRDLAKWTTRTRTETRAQEMRAALAVAAVRRGALYMSTHTAYLPRAAAANDCELQAAA
jgi:hypothetical protein